MSWNAPETAGRRQAKRRGALSGRSAASEMRQRKLAAVVDLAVAIRPQPSGTKRRFWRFGGAYRAQRARLAQ